MRNWPVGEEVYTRFIEEPRFAAAYARVSPFVLPKRPRTGKSRTMKVQLLISLPSCAIPLPDAELVHPCGAPALMQYAQTLRADEHRLLSVPGLSAVTSDKSAGRCRDYLGA